MTTTGNWNGVPGSPCEHRSTGTRRAWCMTCQEWCYRGPDKLHCRWCEDILSDPGLSISRSVLIRWAQAIRDETGLDVVVEEIGAVLGGER